jgi:hypothetical protein
LFSSLLSINTFSSLFLFNMLFTLFTNLIYCNIISSIVISPRLTPLCDPVCLFPNLPFFFALPARKGIIGESKSREGWAWSVAALSEWDRYVCNIRLVLFSRKGFVNLQQLMRWVVMENEGTTHTLEKEREGLLYRYSLVWRNRLHVVR